MNINMKKILILLTGGTFGMQKGKKNNVLSVTGLGKKIHQYVPELKRLADIQIMTICNLDSASLQISHWKKMAKAIYDHLDEFDGFIIIHGTDTMAYTATALSFMLSNLSKPVILTGSITPLFNIRNDARNNLINAVEMATYSSIQEVCILFANKLFRGNRTTKINITGFNAYDSPNFYHLAKIGLSIKINNDLLLKRQSVPQLLTNLSDKVFPLTVIPGLQSTYFDTLLDSDIEAFVIRGYGSGNLPIVGKSILPFIKSANELGKLVLLTSQCLKGFVDLNLYEGSSQAMQSGALSCKDMTFETSIIKAMFLLGYFKGDIKKTKSHYTKNLAGEISEI